MKLPVKVNYIYNEDKFSIDIEPITFKSLVPGTSDHMNDMADHILIDYDLCCVFFQKTFYPQWLTEKQSIKLLAKLDIPYKDIKARAKIQEMLKI